MIVVDASVAMKWVLPEDGSDAAWALRAQNLIAPSYWLLEAANALWRYSRRGIITLKDADSLLHELGCAPVASQPVADDIAVALAFALRLGHPAYDCLYLALAVRHDTHVITADRRFFGACGKDDRLKDRVRLLDGL